MGRLQRIEDTVNATISSYSHIKLFPRGLPFFVDSLLRGQVRFGRRTGNNIAVINPENTFGIIEQTAPRSDIVRISRSSQWPDVGMIVSMGPGKELVKIKDVIENELIFETELSQTYTTSDSILLFAYPLVMFSPANIGDTTIMVKSHHRLGNGDVFGYLQSPGLLQSFTDIKTVEVIDLGTTGDPGFPHLYSLILSKPIGQSLDETSDVFFRAYPGYFSAPVRIPLPLSSNQPLGPVILDILSGRLIEGNNYPEVLSIRTLNRASQYVLGDNTRYITVSKNHVILDRGFSADIPMFWDLAEGTMRLAPNRVLLRVNHINQFAAAIKCVPPITSAKSWRVNLRSTEDCSIRFIFRPYAEQEFNLGSGVTQTVIIQSPFTGDPITDIEINVLAASNVCEVSMSDWTPVGDTVEEIEYALIVEATGEATYQSTGLMVKPYFLSTDFLRANYNLGSTYDGGAVYF